MSIVMDRKSQTETESGRQRASARRRWTLRNRSHNACHTSHIPTLQATTAGMWQHGPGE